MPRGRFVGIMVLGSALMWAGCGSQAATVPIPHKAAATTTPSAPAPIAASSTPGPTPTAASPYPPLIRRTVVAVAASTQVPVAAPTGQAGCSGGFNGGHQCWPGVWYQTTRTSYWIHVGLCPSQQTSTLPLHSIGQARCDQSLAALTSGYSFEGQAHATSLAARHRVLPVRPRQSLTPVPLGTGITGHTSARGLVVWNEGDWNLAVNYQSCPPASHPNTAALTTAKRVVAYLHTHLLPETYGMLTAGGSCGDASSGATALKWAEGHTVYTVQTSGYNPLQAIRLAMAMRPSTSHP